MATSSVSPAAFIMRLFQSRGDCCAPACIPSYALPALPLEWAGVFEDV